MFNEEEFFNSLIEEAQELYKKDKAAFACAMNADLNQRFSAFVKMTVEKVNALVDRVKHLEEVTSDILKRIEKIEIKTNH